MVACGGDAIIRRMMVIVVYLYEVAADLQTVETYDSLAEWLQSAETRFSLDEYELMELAVTREYYDSNWIMVYYREWVDV